MSKIKREDIENLSLVKDLNGITHNIKRIIYINEDNVFVTYNYTTYFQLDYINDYYTIIKEVKISEDDYSDKNVINGTYFKSLDDFDEFLFNENSIFHL